MKRAFLIVAGIATALVVPAAALGENRGTDVLGSLDLAPPGNGLADKYPLSAYALDSHVDEGLVDPGGAMNAMWHDLAGLIWTLTAFATDAAISLLDWAIGVGVVHAALGAVTVALAKLNGVLGQFMIPAIACLGIWATWKGLGQRRYSDVTGKLGISLAIVIAATAITLNPRETVTMVTGWVDDTALAVLGDDYTDNLFRDHVLEPWAILEFNALRHCVDTDRMKDGFPTPVAVNDPRRDVCRDHMKRGADGMGGYADRFLRQSPDSDERHEEYKALAAGKAPDEPQFSGYRVDRNDSPAVDIQQEANATNRLALAFVIAFAALGFIILIGGLALGIVIAQVMLLGCVLLAPLMMLAGFFPGGGHRAFYGWMMMTLGYAVRKALYALGIVIATTLGPALATITSSALLAFLIVGVLFWVLVLKHKAIAGKLGFKGVDEGAVQGARSGFSQGAQGAMTAKAVGAGGYGLAVAAVQQVRSKQDTTTPADHRVQQSAFSGAPADESVRHEPAPQQTRPRRPDDRDDHDEPPGAVPVPAPVPPRDPTGGIALDHNERDPWQAAEMPNGTQTFSENPTSPFTPEPANSTPPPVKPQTSGMGTGLSSESSLPEPTIPPRSPSANPPVLVTSPSKSGDS